MKGRLYYVFVYDSILFITNAAIKLIISSTIMTVLQTHSSIECINKYTFDPRKTIFYLAIIKLPLILILMISLNNPDDTSL